jgi:hypothetical protein
MVCEFEMIERDCSCMKETLDEEKVSTLARR